MTWRLLHRPQQTLLRRAMFQVHLWCGAVLSVYMAVIGVTGSILVFRSEISAYGYRSSLKVPTHAATPQFREVLAAAQRSFPGAVVTSVRSPTRRDPVETVYLRSGKTNSLAMLDPVTLVPLGATRAEPRWLLQVRSLHADLMLGKKGRVWNGVGASALLLLCVTGIVIWWRGATQAWSGMWVRMRSNWRRINFDLHSAVGFWLLGFLLVWAVTGIAFAWPRQFRQAVLRVSQMTPTVVPRLAGKRAGALGGSRAAVVAKVIAAHPGMTFTGADLPANGQAALVVYMTDGDAGDLLHTDYIYVDGTTGEELSVWHRGHPRSLGDWITWSTVPLHYGSYWGKTVEVVWALAGLSLPALSVTGLLMYWNRWLRGRLGAR